MKVYVIFHGKRRSSYFLGEAFFVKKEGRRIEPKTLFERFWGSIQPFEDILSKLPEIRATFERIAQYKSDTLRRLQNTSSPREAELLVSALRRYARIESQFVEEVRKRVDEIKEEVVKAMDDCAGWRKSIAATEQHKKENDNEATEKLAELERKKRKGLIDQEEYSYGIRWWSGMKRHDPNDRSEIYHRQLIQEIDAWEEIAQTLNYAVNTLLSPILVKVENRIAQEQACFSNPREDLQKQMDNYLAVMREQISLGAEVESIDRKTLYIKAAAAHKKAVFLHMAGVLTKVATTSLLSSLLTAILPNVVQGAVDLAKALGGVRLPAGSLRMLSDSFSVVFKRS